MQKQKAIKRGQAKVKLIGNAEAKMHIRNKKNTIIDISEDRISVTRTKDQLSQNAES